MGFFSFKTQDTNKSIANRYSDKKTFTVYMKDNKGNIWKESNYEGYGEFQQKDFYELLAEMNGLQTRDEGIKLYFSDQDFISPNLLQDPSKKWIKNAPESCEFQGYFYGECIDIFI